MRSTFRVLFYTKNQAIKNGRVPVMGRITVNGTTASFSCKRDVPLALWDAKGNCAKGKSEEARRLNRVEKPLNFDPFGHADLSPLAII